MKKTNIRRFVSAACAALVMVAGLCSPVSKCMNVQETTSYALLDEPSYNKYYCLDHYIHVNYGDKKQLTISNRQKVEYENCGTASRKYLPNEMNCTLICLVNLLDYYRYHKLDEKSGEMVNRILYAKLVLLAMKSKYGYSSTGGLSPLVQADLCEAFFKENGFTDCDAIQLLYAPENKSLIEPDLTRHEPYILSSSAKNHSILVKGYSKCKISYKTTFGFTVSKTIYVLDIFDPNGTTYSLDPDEITDCNTDLEQLLYVDKLTYIKKS